MTEGIRSALANLGFASLSQAESEAAARECIDKMRRMNAPELDIVEAEMQIRGGECRWCKKPWEKHASTGIIGTFVFFEPACACIDNQRHHRTAEEARSAEVTAALARSRIPESERGADWSNWDYAISEKINGAMKYCSEFFAAGMWRDGYGLILGGTVGTGKTRCAVMVLRSVIAEHGLQGLFLPMSELATMIIKSDKDSGFIADLTRYRMIVIDDIDKIPQDKDWIKGQVFSLFDALMRANVAIIGTTNCRTPAELQEKFEYAVVSRIMAKSQFVPFLGHLEDDYRMLKARKK